MKLSFALFCGVLLLAAGLCAPVTRAQEARSPDGGFFFNAHLNATRLVLEGKDPAGGGGFGLRVGFGLWRVALFADLGGAGFQNDEPVPGTGGLDGPFGLGHVDLGAQLRLTGPHSALVPYLSGALTGRALGFDETDLMLSGTAFALGGGLRYHFSHKVALDVSGAASLGPFTAVDHNGDGHRDEEINVSASVFRLGVGLTVYPFRGRRAPNE